MCVSFWATLPPSRADVAHRRPTFVLAANRDEFLGRKTLEVEWHDFEPVEADDPHLIPRTLPTSSSHTPIDPDGSGSRARSSRRVLSGRDLADPSGGTWLVVYPHPEGSTVSIGILTNIHDDTPPPRDTLSRGRLLRDWVLDRLQKDSGSAEEWTTKYLEGLRSLDGRYAGYNLLLFDIQARTGRVSGQYHSNRSGQDARKAKTMMDERESRLAGLSNSVLSRPFPKVIAGVDALNKIIQTPHDSEEGMASQLLDLLSTTAVSTIAAREDLHQTISVPMCSLPGRDGTNRAYGTRSSTVVLVYADGTVELVERDRLWIDEAGAVQDEGRADRSFTFRLA